ncbi:hypothetical protein VIGAN_11097200 [Vigna angularis var. angularis]|uniref:Uncharacterized protein n=1 Tax=Vigna angularis var. angularis TaxID=157739 RepID=A0A0S3T928_PHAAN|nr:hypothetical protein VIGAN_11097200 [Vigna angularis var. angularis]
MHVYCATVLLLLWSHNLCTMLFQASQIIFATIVLFLYYFSFYFHHADHFTIFELEILHSQQPHQTRNMH